MCICKYEYESHLDVQHTCMNTHTNDLPISKMAMQACKATVERTTSMQTYMYVSKKKKPKKKNFRSINIIIINRHTCTGYMYLYFRLQAITLYKYYNTFYSADPHPDHGTQGKLSRNPPSRPILIVAHPPSTPLTKVGKWNCTVQS